MKSTIAKSTARAAKVVGIIFVIAIISAAVVALTISGSAVDYEKPLDLPTTVPSGSVDNLVSANATVIKGFEDGEKGTITGENATAAVVENKLELLYGDNDRGQAKIAYSKTNGLEGGSSVFKIAKGTDGLMFYVDNSGATLSEGSTSMAFALALNNVHYSNGYLGTNSQNDGTFRVPKGNEVYAYNAVTSQWTTTETIDVDRVAVPVGFKGYIYLPADKFVLSDDNTISLADVTANYNVYSATVYFYSCGVANGSKVYFDNIMTVDYNGDNYVENGAPTTLPDGRTAVAKGTFWNDRTTVNVTTNTATKDLTKDFTIPADTVGIMYYLSLTDLKGWVGSQSYNHSKVADGENETPYMNFGVDLTNGSTKYQTSNDVPSYYYTDGQWYRTNGAAYGTKNTFVLPEGFEGYIYVPLTSYGSSLTAGKSITKATLQLNSARVNSAFNARNQLIIDDVIFVGASGTAVTNTSPEKPDYIAGGTTGLTTFNIANVISNFESNQVIMNTAPNQTKYNQAMQQSGMAMSLGVNSVANDAELVIDLYDANKAQGDLSFKTKPSINGGQNSGIIFHLDVNGITGKKLTYTCNGKSYTLDDAISFGFAIGFGNDDRWQLKSDGSAVVYYSYDGAEAWNATGLADSFDIVSGDSCKTAYPFAIPADFNGWVYIPYESLANGSTGFTTKSGNIDNIRFFVNDCTLNMTEAAQIRFDDLAVVAEKDAKPIADVSATASTLKNLMSMTEGANIRLGATSGIRFETTVTKTGSTYSDYFGESYVTNKLIHFGTLVIPTSMLGDGTLNETTPNALNIVVKNVWSEDEASMKYTAVVTDIPMTGYFTELTALSYVAYASGYNIDGSYEYTYLMLDTAESRSYGQVAQATLDAELRKPAPDSSLVMALTAIVEAPKNLPEDAALTGTRLITDFDKNFVSAEDGAMFSSVLTGGTHTNVSSVYGSYLSSQNGGSVNAATKVNLKDRVDATGYKGLLFYVDISNAKDQDDTTDHSVGVKLGLYSNATANTADDKDKYSTAGGYLLANGSDTWASADVADGRCVFLPDNFAGYVYIPFTSYQSFGGLSYIGNFHVYCTHNLARSSTILYDNFYLVK